MMSAAMFCLPRLFFVLCCYLNGGLANLYKQYDVDETSFTGSAVFDTESNLSFMECCAKCEAYQGGDDGGCGFFMHDDSTGQCQLGHVQYIGMLMEGGRRAHFKAELQCPHESLGSCPAQNFTIVDHRSVDDVGQFGIDWIADKDLFVEECDIHMFGNYWLAPEGATGDDNAFFVLDYGCCRGFEIVLLKNINNCENDDRTSVDFRLLFSVDEVYDPGMTWATVVQDTLTNAIGKGCAVQTEEFTFPKQPSRFVKFVLDSVIVGGGLNYIKVE